MLLKAITSHYFDDFPTVERTEGCRVLTLAFSAFLNLLGWDHAKEGDKALNVSQVARDQNISDTNASELQGRLNFAVSLRLGRSMRNLVSAFMPFANKHSGADTRELGNLRLYAKTTLLEQQQRVHSVLNVGRPIVVFTDGAWEGRLATAGAVLVDGEVRVAIKLEVPQALVDHWLANAGDQIIYQVQLWGLVLLKWSRKEQFYNCRVLEWIDNESARISAIKARSGPPTMLALSRLMAEVDLQWPSFFLDGASLFVLKPCGFAITQSP